MQVATFRANREGAPGRSPSAAGATLRSRRGAWAEGGSNARCPGMKELMPGHLYEAIECVYRGWRDYEMLSLTCE